MLLCVSASHKTAPFELLERLSAQTTPIAPLIVAHNELVRGAVVVATCNRFEVYVDVDEPADTSTPAGLSATTAAIGSATGVGGPEFNGSSRVVTGPAVAEHLFAVASGLESVVVGEAEIAGQVRRALADARRDGTSSPELERLFQRASQAQRGVKNATALGRTNKSLVRLALDLADSRIADWSRLRVLLIGTGSYAAATLAALRDYGAVDISVYSPSGRAEPFAARHGLGHVPSESYPDTAARSDLIVACTTADTPVLTAATLTAGDGMPSADASARSARSRQLIIDLGLPRNVSPDVADLDADVLDLETIRLHAPLEELEASDAARQVVRDAARRFTTVGERRSATPAVVALRTHAFGLLEQEIARVRARGDDDGRIEQALRHLTGVLLHTPTTRAHELAGEGRADEVAAALQVLFGLDVAEDAASTERTDLVG